MVHILLAEDDKNFGIVLRGELEEGGCVVTLVNDGVEAVLSFLSRAYDFALLDIRMPRLNGIDALRIIKKINPEVPAITFSGNSGRQERQQSMEVGSIKCLTKPFNIALLKEEIKTWLTARKTPSPSGEAVGSNGAKTSQIPP